MNLKEITIKNFRSIKELHLYPEPTCQIFVGEIEAGKSNILKAISYLSKDNRPKKQYIREPSEEENIQESYIDFDFSFSKEEQVNIYNFLKTKIFMKNENDLIINQNGKQFTVFELLAETLGYIRADFIEETRITGIFNISDIEFETNWKVVPTKQTEIIVKDSDSGEEINISNYEIVNMNGLELITDVKLENFKLENLDNYIEDYIVELINKNVPNVVFWEYNEKNLLPPSIDMVEFSQNPNICIPLKAMFDLQRIQDINEKIMQAKETSRNTLINLLRRVAKTTTKHFQQVWPDYKGVEFSLEPDGDNINIAIKDKYNEYDLSSRSDGFKRFVTFLLLISAKNKSNLLTNSIIIVDEPEISLHIKGQRYLMNELINISKNNIVFYSTHSIFMIDKNKIDRHFIVKKEKEITNIQQVNHSNYVDEEVIFNAMGYSIFESLKEFNILFEGWTDYKLFRKALEKIPSQYKDKINDLKNYGNCFNNGVKDIKATSKILDLIPRKYIILSDSDKPAKEKQKDFNQFKENTWYRYDEIFSKRLIITSEDFIIPKTLCDEINIILKRFNIDLIFKEEDLSIPNNGRIDIIQAKLNKKGIDMENIKTILHNLKENIFENLKSTQIEADYYEFLCEFNIIIFDMLGE